MRNRILISFMVIITSSLAACSSGSSTNSPPASTTETVSATGTGANSGSSPTILKAGANYTIPANTTVLVPSGSVVTSTNGNVITINGDKDTIDTQAGSTITVPTTATGTADNVVTTGSGITGSISTQALNIVALAGSATSNIAPHDGTGAYAEFWGGGQLGVNSNDVIILSDRGVLRQVTQAGVVTTLASLANSAYIQGVALDSNGNIYGTSGGNVVSTNPVTWAASVVEINSSSTLINLFPNWTTSTTISYVGMGMLAIDTSNNLFMADSPNQRILKFPASGSWSVFAGNGTSGNLDGTGTQATFNNPIGITVDANNNLYVTSDSAVRKITPDAAVTTVTSNNQNINGSIAVDEKGNIYSAGYQTITRISPSGTITTFSFPNTTDFVTSMATDKAGNLYVGTRGMGAQIFRISF